jgi:hypothetical protein
MNDYYIWLKCSQCDYKSRIGQSWPGEINVFMYQLSGAANPYLIETSSSWCTTCGGLREVETLSVAHYEREIDRLLLSQETARVRRSLVGWVRRLFSSTKERHLDADIALYRNLIDFLQRRTYRKCLWCGSMSVSPPFVSGETIHPNCGGALRIEKEDLQCHMSGDQRATWRLYSVEGEFLDERRPS